MEFFRRFLVKIQEKFFPELELKYLFKREEEKGK